MLDTSPTDKCKTHVQPISVNFDTWKLLIYFNKN